MLCNALYAYILAATPNLLILCEGDLGARLTARARIRTYTDLYV